MSESGESKVDFGRNPFELKIGETFATLKFFGDLRPDLVREFDRRMRAPLENLVTDLVIDLTEAGTIHPVWTRGLMQIVTSQKKNLKRVKTITGNPIHRSFFKDQGITASFPILPDLAAAMRELDAKRAKLDATFINPFLEGTVEILKRQADTNAKAGAFEVREASAPMGGDISGVIILQSEDFMGSVIIGFPETTYLKIISKMLGETHSAITGLNRDGAAELMNWIYGHAKRIHNENGHTLKMAIPTIILGKDPEAFPALSGPRIAIPFESDSGKFTLEIQIQTL